MINATAEIITAIRENDLHRLQKAFANNPDQINQHTFMNGRTALGYAARDGNLEIVGYLIDIGFDVNKGDRHDGARPICDAADGDQYDVAKYLLDRGATVEAESSVQDPLFAAIVGRSPRIVELLLQAGANSRTRYNSETMTDMDAVAFAIMRGEVECAELIAMWNSGGNREAALAALREAQAVVDRSLGPPSLDD